MKQIDDRLSTVRKGNENLVKLTPSAGEKTRTLIAREKKGDFLRLGISGGGCNGLTYKMAFTSDVRENDILVDTADVHVLVDAKSALYLRGTELDYSHALMGGGFKFHNPNAQGSCSCGESFNL